MIQKRSIRGLIILAIVLAGLFYPNELLSQSKLRSPENIVCGAERIDQYIDLLKGRQVGLVANPSSRIGDKHLLDSLLSLGISVKKIFCPEHGFRGKGEAGELIVDHKDPITGLEVVSIYGKKKKPDERELRDLDVLVFDIQDVGARFYTYISTLHYIMEAAAEQCKDVIVLDRPNPNGFYVAGPVREDKLKSFVGMHPIPVVHGMTIGEYAKMINGEGWLAGGLQCKLKVISCKNYDHLCLYKVPVKPSPNLPNQKSIYLYPSLCFFEGTKVSIGRGTDFPFQVFGHPDIKGDFTFTPTPKPGASTKPKLEGILCSGLDLRDCCVANVFNQRDLVVEWMLFAFKELGSPEDFFTSYFDTLAGTTDLREQIIQGWTANRILASWEEEIEEFKLIRGKYLLYPDFE